MARRSARRRVPMALRRAYGDRARRLGEAVLSLLPPPPRSTVECRCRGARCLACGRAQHLLRDGDPPDYRRLLSRSFCAVSPDAPFPPVVFLASGVAQRLVVRNIVESRMGSETLANVLCSSYDKKNCLNPGFEFLCTRAWELLLSRIGDPLMVFLLHFSSIFMPLSCRSHYQVTGRPLCDFIWRPDFFSKTPMHQSQQLMWMGNYIRCGHRLKRRQDESEDRQKKDVFFCVPSNLQGVDSFVDYDHSITDNKRRKFVKQCETTCRKVDVIQIGLQDISHDIIEGFQVESNRNSGEPARPQLCDASNQTLVHGGHDSLCIHKDYARGHDQVETGGNTLSSQPQATHLEQVSLSSRNINGAFESCYTDSSRRSSNFAFYCNSRKYARIYSWQRRRKFKKVNSFKENRVDKCSSVVADDESSRMELQQTYDTNSSHRPLDPPRLVSNGIISESHNLGGKLEASHKEIASLTVEEMCQEMVICNINLHVVKSRSEHQLGKEPHVSSDNVGSPSKYSQEILESGSLVNNITLNDLHNRFLPDEISLTKYGLSMNIDFLFMLYANSVDNILNRLKPNDSGAISLIKQIFGFPDTVLNTILPCSHCCGFSAIKSKCMFHSVLSLLKSLIRNAQRCSYKKLLHRHCAIPAIRECCQDDGQFTSEVMKKKSSSLKISKEEITILQHRSHYMRYEKAHGVSNDKEHKKQVHEDASKVCDRQFGLIESYSRHQQVVSFVWAVTRSIIPLDFLGDSSAWRGLRKNIAKFVGLRRFENFGLKQCIHGLKTSCYPFLSKMRLFDGNCDHAINHESGSCKNMKKGHWQPSLVKIVVYENFFRNWIYWFFNYIVVPLIENNFYVTERESRKHNIYYYLKPVWKKLVDGAITCLKEQNYRLIDNASLGHIISKRSFGFSKVRFLPKEKTVRPLANLKAPSKIWLYSHGLTSRDHFVSIKNNVLMQHRSINAGRKRKLVQYQSVNSALHELYVVLRRIKVEEPHKLGCSVFDYDDVYRKLYQFLSQVRKGSSAIPEVFIVVADVSKAFDSIDQCMLIGIMKDVIRDDEYFFRKYVKIICTKKSIRTLYDHVCFHQSSNNYNITEDKAFICSGPSNSILIDQGLNKSITQEKLHGLLSEHLKCNILQFAQNFYLQKIGISQGSLLSSLLCSFYYGHLESNVIIPYLGKMQEQPGANFKSNEVIDRHNFSNKDCSHQLENNKTCSLQLVENNVEHLGCLRANNLAKGTRVISDGRHGLPMDNESSGSTSDFTNETSSLPNYLLLRLIDDFLFISTSRNQAMSFFNRIRRGFREYNCFMNDAKFGLNFDADQSSCLPNRIYTGSDGVSFLPWSGLLLNCHTLEIQADYTRYWGIHIGSTITIVADARPGHRLKEKLCDYMRPKCHPIFYDSSINSPATVRLNAYQAFLLCAMKFHCYICNMPCKANLCPKFLLEIIHGSFSYMYQLIKKRMYDMEPYLSSRPVLRLKKAEVIWLGWSAYIRVLRKKQSRHKELLLLLRSNIMELGKMDDASSYLRYAVDDSHSSLFWKIKY